MESRTYKTLQGHKLLPWYSIRIETRGGSKHVTFCSRVHVNTEVEVGFCYDAYQFSDHQILADRDLMTWVINRYGVSLFDGDVSAG